LKRIVAVPKRRKARLKGDISATVNLAAIGVNADVNTRNIIIAIFFIKSVWYKTRGHFSPLE
jgi:hypothetical protein